ncbi:hypothetical protein BJI46_03905 [Acinetobacter qingfengensis]|uniref:Uncharacterized protein n=1 Tax=Acinetobacter qingfengensis TaxID=1262585 RepID=A0A1E7R580_9GAMM|nr:hypothetical protein BJI46_03905 [Acinetobacter qingfengensis]
MSVVENKSQPNKNKCELALLPKDDTCVKDEVDRLNTTVRRIRVANPVAHLMTVFILSLIDQKEKI